MVDNDVGGVVTMVDHTSNAVPLRLRDASFAKRLNQWLRKSLCLFSILRSRPLPDSCPASLGTSKSGKAQKTRAHQPIDSEGSERSPKTTPTPSSYQPAGFSSPAHPVQEPARSTQRLIGSEALDEESPHLKKPEANKESSVEYKLVLIQQPTCGAAFEDNLLGRIGLAPPLILELQVLKNGILDPACEELPFLICQCSLLDEFGSAADMVDQSAPATTKGTHLAVPSPSTAGPSRGRRASGRRSAASLAVPSQFPESTARPTSGDSEGSAIAAAPTSQLPRISLGTEPSQNEPQLVRMLYGTIVAGPQQCNSPEGVEKSYFFFPEISIRTPGKFKIKCTLMRLALPGMPASSETGELASAETQVFQVTKRHEYSAPYITDISRHFARQGVPLLLPPGATAD